MAGTRLTIQLIFVSEFFLLAVVALFFGLFRTKDPISNHLPFYQGGRSLIQASLRQLEEDTPPVLELPQVSTTATSKSALSIHGQSPQRKPLKMTMMVEQQRKDWGKWAEAVSLWIQANQQSLLSWPCIRNQSYNPRPQQQPIETQVILSSLVENSPSSFQHLEKNSTRFISTSNVLESIVNRQRDASRSWNVIVYIPRNTPVQFHHDKTETGNSHAMYIDNTLVTTIGQPELITVNHTQKVTTIDEEGNQTTHLQSTQEQVIVPLDKLIQDAMAPLGEFLLHQCMGLVDDPQAFDGSLPQWQTEAWLKRAVVETYRQLRTEIRNEAEWLLQSSTWVVIDETVAAHWQRLVGSVQKVVRKVQRTETNHAYDGNTGTRISRQHALMELMAILEDTLDELQVLRTEPTLMEPLRFSAPQFLAIFAPLCLPLFLPHFIGLLREWKRYKQLTAQKTP